MPASESPASTLRTGLVQGVGAYLMWGFLPLYFALLIGVGAGEVVASRIVWSLLLVVGLVAALGRLPLLVGAMRNRRAMLLLCASAALIAANWLVYIWAVQHHHVLAGSLGYFLNPLVNVVLGVVVLRERLTRPQTVAVTLAALGVGILAVRAGEGLWISLSLGVSFGLYGLVRKVAPVEALEGLALETAILTPPSLVYLAWLQGQGALAFGAGAGTTALLVASGAVTAIPLLLFAASARRLRYSTVGLLQYLAPTIQFGLAVWVFHETFTVAHMICFALIWTGLAIFAGSGMVAAGRDRVRART